MIWSPTEDAARGAVRQAQVAVASSVAVVRPTRDESGAQQVGANDPVTGEWVGYGLVGVTPIGSFRVRG